MSSGSRVTQFAGISTRATFARLGELAQAESETASSEIKTLFNKHCIWDMKLQQEPFFDFLYIEIDYECLLSKRYVS